MGELLANLFGWLGDFIQWLFGWVPRYYIVQCNELGVRYHMGHAGVELKPGVHWYVPNLAKMVSHYTSCCVLRVSSIPLETSDGIRCEIGLVIVYRLLNVIAYEVENYNAEDSMEEVAQGALQDIVSSHRWAELCARTEDGSRLGRKLVNRMSKALDRFGVEVLSCRPNDQVRLGDGALRLFGVSVNVHGEEKVQPS